MEDAQLSPASLSELDDASSSTGANSPDCMSISSTEAGGSPYDSSRLSGDDDLSLSDSSISSPPPSPSSESVCNNNNQYNSQQQIWPGDINPYYSRGKSIRWFRDDRGLWSERSNSTSSSRRNSSSSNNNSSSGGGSSPYQRNTQQSTRKEQQHKEISEILIEAVRRQDKNLLHNLLGAGGKGSAHVNILGQEGDSPLHRSCRLGNLETVKLLVSFTFLLLLLFFSRSHSPFHFHFLFLSKRFVTVPIRNWQIAKVGVHFIWPFTEVTKKSSSTSFRLHGISQEPGG